MERREAQGPDRKGPARPRAGLANLPERLRREAWALVRAAGPIARLPPNGPRKPVAPPGAPFPFLGIRKKGNCGAPGASLSGGFGVPVSRAQRST